MGDELRHLNSACGCVIPEDNGCDDSNTCGGFGGSWLWIIVIFFLFCGCGNGIGSICSSSIDCGDLVTIILILLFLNCLCNDGNEGGFLSGIFG